MRRLLKYINGNPAMNVILERAIAKLEHDQPLDTAEKVVCNELLTRAQARLNEIEASQQTRLKNQSTVPNTAEQKDLKEAIPKLRACVLQAKHA